MSTERPPSLTPRRRRDIEEMLQVGKAAEDRLHGDPKGEDFQRVYAVGLEAMLAVSKLELNYKLRFIAATEARDTGMMLAAAYGLQKEMRGPARAADDGFLGTFLSRGINHMTNKQMQQWLDDFGTSQIGTYERRRALIEYMEEKLVELDVLVAAREERKSEVEPEAEDDPAPAPGM